MSQRGEAFSWRDTALGIDSPGQQPEIAGPELWGELPNPALIPAPPGVGFCFASWQGWPGSPTLRPAAGFQRTQHPLWEWAEFATWWSYDALHISNSSWATYSM